MTDILAEILENKRREVAAAQTQRPHDTLPDTGRYADPRRNFYGAVTLPRGRRPNLIAEIKKASPSAGLIRPDFDPVQLARWYAEAGAAALSVLTDEHYFQGHPDFIAQVKDAVDLPVLRKDFIVDTYQLRESRALGADCILLIGEALPPREIVALAGAAQALDLCVLLEVHSRDVLLPILEILPRALHPALLLGINNRDLKRQVTDLATTDELAALIPPGLPIVSESGVKTRRDVERLFAAGARALLIGETLLRCADPRDKIHELLGT